MRTGAFVVIAAAALVACPGTLDMSRFASQDAGADGSSEAATSGDAAPRACPDVPTVVFGPACGGSCHAGAMPISNLDLASPNVAERLSGKPAVGGPGLLIDPTNPGASLVYTKMTATTPFGGRMPPSPAEPIDDATAACVLDWIRSAAQAGAPAPVPQGNLVHDPGFEEQTINRVLGAPWATVSSGSPYEIGTDLNTGQARVGANSAFIFAPNAVGSTFSAISEDVTVARNTSYHVSGWIRSSANFGTDGKVGAKAGSTVLEESSFSGNSTDYTEVSVDFDSGSNEAVTIYFGYTNAGGTTSYIQLDDVSVVAK